MSERWKQIPAFEEWEASTLGRVRDRKTKRIVTQRLRGAYLAVRLRGIRVMVHQLVMVTFKGQRSKGMEVSHINENSLDNRPLNLKWATPKENSNMPLHRKRLSEANKQYYRNPKMRKQTSASCPIGASKFRGVTKNRRKWQAQIRINRLEVYIGSFDTARLAALAWDKYVHKHKLSRTTNKEKGLL